MKAVVPLVYLLSFLLVMVLATTSCSKNHLEYAVEEGSADACKNLRSSDDELICMSILAVLNDDYIVCDGLQVPEKIAICIAEYTMYTHKSCRVTDNQDIRDMCWEFRENHNNRGYAKQVKLYIARKSLDPQKCYGTKKILDRIECIASLAEKSDNPSLCLNLKPDQGAIDLCYDALANYTDQRVICKKIVDDDYRRHCFKNVHSAFSWYLKIGLALIGLLFLILYIRHQNNSADDQNE